MTPRSDARTVLACLAAMLLGGCLPASTPLLPPAANLVSMPTGLRDAPRSQATPVLAVRRSFFLESDFAREQLRHHRVRGAEAASRARVERMFQQAGLRFPAAEVYLRVFKQNRALELWARSEGQDRFQLLKTYRICALAGGPGPKLREGDAQVPEGFYNIDLFNPNSEYHLSLRIDYPNRRDRSASRGGPLGGNIFIHGGCRSEGCLAITDDGIRELYWVALVARSVGQQNIPVHIYPARFETRSWQHTERQFSRNRELLAFWNSLKPGYQFFERERRIPRVAVAGEGRYQLLE